MHTQRQTHRDIHTHRYIDTDTDTHTHTHKTHTDTHIHTHTHTDKQTYIHTGTCTHVHKHRHTYTHRHTETDTHMQICTQSLNIHKDITRTRRHKISYSAVSLSENTIHLAFCAVINFIGISESFSSFSTKPCNKMITHRYIVHNHMLGCF